MEHITFYEDCDQGGMEIVICFDKQYFEWGTVIRIADMLDDKYENYGIVCDSDDGKRFEIHGYYDEKEFDEAKQNVIQILTKYFSKGII